MRAIREIFVAASPLKRRGNFGFPRSLSPESHRRIDPMPPPPPLLVVVAVLLPLPLAADGKENDLWKSSLVESFNARKEGSSECQNHIFVLLDGLPSDLPRNCYIPLSETLVVRTK